MFKKIALILYIASLPLLVGCAWSNEEEVSGPKDTVIEVTMRMGGAIRDDLFYYIVFNLTGQADKMPLANFSDENRGENWTVYYMYGTPPRRLTEIYRGYGQLKQSEPSLIDESPIEQKYLNELLDGTAVAGNTMKLRINLKKLPIDKINMNMIVCNQAIDAESRLEYEYEPWVYDSLKDGGITINLRGNDIFWNEVHNPREDEPNENELVAPPEADIVGWQFRIVSR